MINDAVACVGIDRSFIHLKCSRCGAKKEGGEACVINMYLYACVIPTLEKC